MNKSLLKKISLGVFGIGILGGCITLFSHFMNNSDKTLHLDYDIGALTDQGKYLEDECKLYTKKAFACEGLRVTFDFDAEVNGQFYFYDINDKYLSKSEVITEGTSVSVPLNGAYARAVVIPTNDEDGSISFTEKYKYASQMQVKVDKKAESNISQKFTLYHGMLLQTVSNMNDAIFQLGLSLDDNCYINPNSTKAESVTTTTLINIDGYKSMSMNVSILEAGSDTFNYYVYEFTELPKSDSTFILTGHSQSEVHSFSKGAKFMLLQVKCGSDEFTSLYNGKYNQAFTLSK